jgi:hypothetical protein
MIETILDAIYYCCYREKPKISTESVIQHLEKLAEHEVRYVVNKVLKNRDRLKSCC